MMSTNTQTWLRGLGAAFIVGGAGAITSAQVAMGIAPNTFNYSTGFGNLAKMAAITFMVQGALGAFAYLKQSPLPALVATTTTTSETTTISQSPVEAPPKP